MIRTSSLHIYTIINNKAAQYLLTDNKTRKIEYERAKRQRNQNVPPNRHWTIFERIKAEKNQKLNLQKKSSIELLLEIAKLKKQANFIRKRRVDLEKERDEIVKYSRLTLYKEYMRGILAEPIITTCKLTHIETYKNQHKINAEEHLNTLKILKYNIHSFDALKSYDNVTTNQDECVVCYDPPKDHMIIPCNHVCLCHQCAQDNFPAPHDNQKCPLCSKDIQNVQQVYYF